jgi:hypothetical protein
MAGPAHNVIRLVGDADAAPLPAPLRPDDPALQVALENRSAAAMSPRDARWVLAVRTSEAIEGGGALSPEARSRLKRLAGGLGLRPFDANLVIAIVQDGARTGDGALGTSVAERLELVRGAPERDRAAWMPFLVIGMGLGIAAVLIRWVLIT